MNPQLGIVSIDDTATTKMKILPRNDPAAHSSNTAKAADTLGDRNGLSLPKIVVRQDTQQ